MIDISIKKNPLGEWNFDEGDRQTELFIDEKDFDEIQKLINISLPPFEQFNDEISIDFQNVLKEEYLKTASEKGYAMLGRIWDWYDDAVYLSSEVKKLREECIKVKIESQSLNLKMTVDKIIFVCDDALKTNSGLLFACD